MTSARPRYTRRLGPYPATTRTTLFILLSLGVLTACGCSAASCSTGRCKMVSGMPTCFIDQPAACGTGGGTCTACTYGILCNGACTSTIDGNAQFKVIVTAASFYRTDVDGNCWDNYAGFGCAQPDPTVCFGHQSGASLIEACNTQQSDVPADASGVDSVTWTETTGLVTSGGAPFLIPGALFVQGGKVRVSIYDVDAVNANDLIAQAYVNATSMYNNAYVLSAFGRSKSISFELR